MEEEKKVRLSIVMTESEHKYLKMCCVKLGISIKDFVLNATIDKVDLHEDDWMMEIYAKRDENREGAGLIHTNELLKELDLVGAI